VKDHYEVVMPKLGLIMTEARLVEWYKQDGERVVAGEPLFALESDKSTIDIEAPAAGIVQILVPVGETVPVLTPVAHIFNKEGVVLAEPRQSVPKTAVFPQTIRATPKARALARQRGIDLSGIRGSGLREMVVTADLDRISQPAAVNATPVARKMAADVGLDLAEVRGTGRDGRITRKDVTQAIAAIVGQRQAAPSTQKLPLSGLRGVIAERLSASWRERPQVTLTTEVDATNLVSARQQLHAELAQKVSFNAFFVAAAARALQEQPHVNVRLTDTGLVQLPNIHIGVAVDTERGLLVPVVGYAAGKSIVALEAEMSELVQRALAGRSLPDELAGGTFTITNLGVFGIDAFTPLINPPETAVLGIGRIAKRPFASGEQLEVRDTVILSLSFDHRLLDGAPAARFLQRIATLIERPVALIGVDYETE